MELPLLLRQDIYLDNQIPCRVPGLPLSITLRLALKGLLALYRSGGARYLGVGYEAADDLVTVDAEIDVKTSIEFIPINFTIDDI